MGAPDSLFAELSKWRAKASKRGTPTSFTSEIIPFWLTAQIDQAQEAIGIEAFDFLKAPDDVQRRTERKVQRRIDAVFEEWEQEALQAVEQEKEPDYDGLRALLLAALLPILTSIATEEAMRLSVEQGIVFDPAELALHANRWARSYGFDLVSKLTNTTRETVRTALQSYLETPGMSLEDIAQMLKPAFGEVRSDMIAVTETTRAYSEATNEIQRRLIAQGLNVVRIWYTKQDERVCDICGPLHGKPESEWSAEFPDGPPAHPRCRCDILLREVSNA